MKLSDSEINILGIIRKGYKYGYEIEKFIEKEEMRDWTSIGFSSIYYVLGRLEKKGCINSGKDITANNIIRKIFEITEFGIEIFDQNVIRLLSKPDDVIFPFDMALYFKDFLQNKIQMECLQQLIDKYEADKQKLTNSFEGFETNVDKLILKRGISFFNAEISFIREIIAEINS